MSGAWNPHGKIHARDRQILPVKITALPKHVASVRTRTGMGRVASRPGAQECAHTEDQNEYRKCSTNNTPKPIGKEQRVGHLSHV